MTPDISVIIPHYNSGGVVTNAVQSALDQAGIMVEVIVADDCSTDGSEAFVLAMAGNDPRIRLYRLARNGGPSAARNLGLAHCRAPWVAILDADDTFLPGRLATLKAKAEQLHADALADNLLVRRGNTSFNAFPREWMEDDRPLSIVKLLRWNTPWDYPALPIGFMKPMFRKEFLSSHGIKYDERLRIAEDYLIYFDILKASGKFCLVDSTGYVANQDGASVSRGDPTIPRRVLDVQHLLMRRMQDASEEERAALKRRKDALSLELLLTEVRSRRYRGAIPLLFQIRPSFLLGRTKAVLMKRLAPSDRADAAS